MEVDRTRDHGVAAGGQVPLNASQRRNVSSTFSYVDGLLRKIEHAIAGEGSPFAPERPDIGPGESRLLGALVQGVRQRMLLALDRLGIPRPRPALSARWSVETTFNFADIAIAELNEASLRGYGTLDPAAAAEVTAVAGDLRRVLERGHELFRGPSGVDLKDRLRSVPGDVGDVLRTLEALSTEHGLVEIRAPIVAAAERATAKTFDVGVFGRVSSGKSSLINAIVGRPVLPVGSTPVTAVPVRIQHGPPAATVTFVDGRRETVALAAIPEYATEARNPENVREVAAVDVTVPEVSPGLLLLDTPGVGSLALSGAAQTFAWLPRCDLGLVLVAAGTPLGKDELSLVTALHGAGIGIHVLLSKADLLSLDDRKASIAYLRRDLARAVDDAVGMSVSAVSAKPEAVDLLDAWKTRELAPLVASRREAAEQALRRRLSALVNMAGRAYAGRQQLMDEHVLSRQKVHVAAERRIKDAADALDAGVGDDLDRVARAVADAWRSGGDGRATAQHQLMNRPAEALAAVRRAADSPLDEAEGDGVGAVGETGARIPPLFDPELLEAIPVGAHGGTVARMLGWRSVRHDLEPLAEPLTAAYGRYAARIRAWGLARLAENTARGPSGPEDDGSTPLPPPFDGLLARLRTMETSDV
ncbi:MAG: dynamin family protein [Gemmatimonadaceae bacterium]